MVIPLGEVVVLVVITLLRHGTLVVLLLKTILMLFGMNIREMFPVGLLSAPFMVDGPIFPTMNLAGVVNHGYIPLI
jgi:hypothetical protein